MTDPVSALKSLKDGIQLILQELKAIQVIEQLNFSHIPVYHKAVSMLDISVQRVLQLYDYKTPIPDHVALKIVMVDIINLQMLQFHSFLQCYKEWAAQVYGSGDVKSKCWGWKRCCAIICKPPSAIKQELDNMFQRCFESIKEMVQLEGSILGSAIRIKHPILQNAWLKAGANDINASELSNSLIGDALFVMLRTELQGEIKDKVYCRQLVQTFVDKLDGTLGSEKNGKLSMDELNECKDFHISTVAQLLGFKDTNALSKDDIESVKLTIEWLNGFDGKASIDHTCARECDPFPNSYGSDFNNKRAVQFRVTPSSSHEKSLIGVKVRCCVSDQGYGGTKHAHLRYSVNDDKQPINCLNINRDVMKPTDWQEIALPPSAVHSNDIVTVWLYCPGWNGWQCKLLNIEAVALYA
jgi:hypothetical protein